MRKTPNQHVPHVRILVRDAMPRQAETSVETDADGNETAASVGRRKAAALRYNIARDELIGLWLASHDEPCISVPEDARLLVEQWQAEGGGKLRRKGGRRPDEHSNLTIAMTAHVAVSRVRRLRKARQGGAPETAEWRITDALKSFAEKCGRSFQAVYRLHYDPEMQRLVAIEFSRLRRERGLRRRASNIRKYAQQG